MRLKSLVRIATARWVKIGVLILWILSFLSMFRWVRDSYEVFPGGYEHRWNYFEIHRTALFVWLSLLLFGYAAHHFKQGWPGWYGVVEIAVGILGGFVAVQRLPIGDAASWFALAASAYVMVRGAGNVDSAMKDEADAVSSRQGGVPLEPTPVEAEVAPKSGETNPAAG